MTLTIFTKDGDGIFESQPPPGVGAGAVENLVEGRPAGLLDQEGAQVLLQGLVRPRGPESQDGVRLGRDILDLDTGHGAILAPMAPTPAPQAGTTPGAPASVTKDAVVVTGAVRVAIVAADRCSVSHRVRFTSSRR